jgi:di/tricarboxylate transporter
MFAINKPRLDAVALIMLVALPFTGVLTVGEALARRAVCDRRRRVINPVVSFDR